MTCIVESVSTKNVMGIATTKHTKHAGGVYPLPTSKGEIMLPEILDIRLRGAFEASSSD